MTLVDANQLLASAKRQGFSLCTFELPDPSLADAVLSGAEVAKSPVILQVNSSMDLEGIMPTIEASARRSTAPTVICCQADSMDQVVRAINLGCNGIDCESKNATAVAKSCGVTVVNLVENSAIISHINNLDRIATEQCRKTSGKADFMDHIKGVQEAVRDEVARCLHAAGSSGRARTVLSECAIWSNVEHCIIYNVTEEDEERPSAESLMAEGRRALAKIPGVREVITGLALTPDAQYRYCWIIKFVHPSVIDSFRHHPDHVKFANTRFRPIASDRISIDFQRIE